MLSTFVNLLVITYTVADGMSTAFVYLYIYPLLGLILCNSFDHTLVRAPWALYCGNLDLSGRCYLCSKFNYPSMKLLQYCGETEVHLRLHVVQVDATLCN